MTWAPASSSALAQWRLRSSSKRAISSTTAVTCLPRSAARMSAATTGESVPGRYSVCLMASTSGSSAACSTSARTASNASYGWWTRMSPASMRVEDRGPPRLRRAPGRASCPGRAAPRTPAPRRCSRARGGRGSPARGRDPRRSTPASPASSDARSSLGSGLDLEPHDVALPPSPQLLLDGLDVRLARLHRRARARRPS